MKLYGWLGLLLLLASEYCLFHKIDPFYSWFYSFAWWSYILLADNLLFKLRGRSLFCGRRAELPRMLPLSVFFWLLFECYNLVLRNWQYNGVPAETWIRWTGYAVAFSTVLPGVFITADLIEFFLFRRRDPTFASEHETMRTVPRTHSPLIFIGIGLALSVAPLLWPRYFFPAVWIGPIFLLDPTLERLGIKGFWSQIQEGNCRRIVSLLLGGLACGVMWEFWNYWAPAHWVYSVPYFGMWKVFQMPLLGFWGFPPFALECWSLYHLLSKLQRPPVPRYVFIAFWLGIAIFCALVFHAIDRHTVLQFAWNHRHTPILPNSLRA